MYLFTIQIIKALPFVNHYVIFHCCSSKNRLQIFCSRIIVFLPIPDISKDHRVWQLFSQYFHLSILSTSFTIYHSTCLFILTLQTNGTYNSFILLCILQHHKYLSFLPLSTNIEHRNDLHCPVVLLFISSVC